MKTLDEMMTALEVCGNEEPLKCPYFDSENWKCCNWRGCRRTHRIAMMDDVFTFIKENFGDKNEDVG